MLPYENNHFFDILNWVGNGKKEDLLERQINHIEDTIFLFSLKPAVLIFLFYSFFSAASDFSVHFLKGRYLLNIITQAKSMFKIDSLIYLDQ